MRLVERLFLEPDTVDAPQLLRASADGVADQVPWLMVRYEGRDGVRLTHGSGALLGTVSVDGMDDLPRALANLEAVVTGSGHDPGPGVDVRLAVLQGMTDALDRYSKVLAGDRLDRFNVRLKGTLVGIGARFEVRDDVMRVRSVVADGPAQEGGLLAGDRILRIDGRSTVNMPMSEAERRVRGESGSTVVLTIARGDTTLELGLRRDRIVVPNVTHRVLDGDVGYVRIDHISQQTVTNLRQALDDLQILGALEHGLVLDLRGNTGGSMKEAARSADQFLAEGLLLRTVGPDGGRVQNLQAEMQASEEGTDLADIPIVVLMDPRTASGSEIMAGALVELDRAALIGTRSYGKGTVQKIYNLDDDTRLKLTVARYILANDRRIEEGGLAPDIAIGRIELDSYGVRFPQWEERLRVPWDAVLPELVEQEGWRGVSPVELDLAEELARRAILATEGPSRAAILDSLRTHAAVLRAEQETALTTALSARGLDWSPAPEDGTFMNARVEVEARPGSADTLELRVSVVNDGPEPLHRALVHLSSDTAPWWTGVVVPVGRVAPGATATGEARVPLNPGVDQREDPVTVRLRADRRPPLLIGDTVLVSGSSPEPDIRLSARLVPHNGETGPNGWPVLRAEVTVHNESRMPVTGVEVHFGFPGDENVELLDYASRVSLIRGRGSERLDLAIEVGPDAPATLPLEVVVESERYRTLADWPLQLPTDGTPVELSAPRIDLPRRQLSAPAGPYPVPLVVADDRTLDHVVVRANGRKLAWYPGGTGELRLAPEVDLLPGANRVIVTAVDDQGLEEVRGFTIRGEDRPAAADAE